VDVTFALTPSYIREASFGVVGLASGLYRLDPADSLMPPSNATLTGNLSLLGFYAIGIDGNNYFKGNRSLLTYEVRFMNRPLNFWGISYEACSTNPPITYTRRQIKINANYLYKPVNNIYMGGALDFHHTSAAKIDDVSYLEGQKLSCTLVGLGVSVRYDSRDFIPNPQRGIYLMFRETVFPKELSNCDRTLFRHTVIADFYRKVWRGGLLALDIYGRFTDNAHWSLKEELGSDGFRMRGYYAGRYIDNNIISAQVEIRQHISGRLGCVAWAGSGAVFPSLRKFQPSGLLPTYGLGLRYEFKRNINIRIDYGFGKQTRGFIFNIGEAF
jgi:outer membrane protein assembly factor BamA